MEKEEIYEMVIREMMEYAIRKRNMELTLEEQKLIERSVALSKHLRERLKIMPAEDQQLITENIETKLLIADHECTYLYVQGAKDCVELLKKLGVLSKTSE